MNWSTRNLVEVCVVVYVAGICILRWQLALEICSRSTLRLSFCLKMIGLISKVIIWLILLRNTTSFYSYLYLSFALLLWDEMLVGLAHLHEMNLAYSCSSKSILRILCLVKLRADGMLLLISLISRWYNEMTHIV